MTMNLLMHIVLGAVPPLTFDRSQVQRHRPALRTTSCGHRTASRVLGSGMRHQPERTVAVPASSRPHVPLIAKVNGPFSTRAFL